MIHVPDGAEDLALDTRSGLPDALRELVRLYPRAGWEENPNFGGLVQFWLERHMMFRRLGDLLREDAERLLDRNADPAHVAGRLSRYGGMLVGELQGHHGIEDMHYFPVLARRESALARGFEVLDADHHALEADLATFVERANAVMGGVDAPDLRDRAGAYHEHLLRLARLLDRHLVDEEELVVPVILKHGPAGLG